MVIVYFIIVICKFNKGYFRYKESIEKILCVLVLKVLEFFCMYL